jgi:nicotinamidase-related amidase
MPLSTIDPTPALVVIDLQSGTMAAPVAHPAGEVLEKTVSLVDAFRSRNLPVVLVNVAGIAPGRTDGGPGGGTLPAEWTELASELGDHPDDHKVTKDRWGAFTGTTLHEHLRNRGVTQVVLTGISTSIGVESTARTAYEHGYHVVLATDAMTDTDIEAHTNSITKIFPKLGETASTTDILAALP